MKVLIFILLFVCPFFYSTAQVRVGTELKAYTEFLKSQQTSAKAYILSLFEDHDIVVLCERDYKEITQYDLFLDIMEDPYFIENVGVVFTEVGAKNLNPQLNYFLQDNLFSDIEVNRQTLNFLRKCKYPHWSNYNFAYFIRGLREINKDVPWNSKIEMYPCDEFYVSGDLTLKNVSDMIMRVAIRNSLMADNIIGQYETMKQSGLRKKALVIMNCRHAYNNKFTYIPANSEKVKSTTEFLFDRYPGRVANVLINTFFTKKESVVLQDGKWDAAFKVSGNENLGFHFKGSPFGKDNFDHWTYKNNFTYQDIYTGFVFYLPIEKHRLVGGFPHLMEDAYLEKCIQKVQLWNDALQRIPGKVSVESIVLTEEELMRDNVMHVDPIDDLDNIIFEIDKWIGVGN